MAEDISTDLQAHRGQTDSAIFETHKFKNKSFEQETFFSSFSIIFPATQNVFFYDFSHASSRPSSVHVVTNRQRISSPVQTVR